MPELSVYRPVVGAVLVASACVAVSLVAVGLRATLTLESGGLEVASIALWGYALMLTWVSRPQLGRSTWPIVLLFAIFILRELDFHDWWFEPGLLQTQIFSSPVPLWQKLVSGFVMLGVLAVLGTVGIGGLRPFWLALRQREAWPFWIIAAVALALVSTAIDGIGRKLAPFGIEVGPDASFWFAAGEEVMELMFSFCVIVALATARRSLGAPRP